MESQSDMPCPDSRCDPEDNADEGGGRHLHSCMLRRLCTADDAPYEGTCQHKDYTIYIDEPAICLASCRMWLVLLKSIMSSKSTTRVSRNRCVHAGSRQQAAGSRQQTADSGSSREKGALEQGAKVRVEWAYEAYHAKDRQSCIRNGREDDDQNN